MSKNHAEQRRRRSPCPCGSGKIYRKCCLKDFTEFHKLTESLESKERAFNALSATGVDFRRVKANGQQMASLIALYPHQDNLIREYFAAASLSVDATQALWQRATGKK